MIFNNISPVREGVVTPVSIAHTKFALVFLLW